MSSSLQDPATIPDHLETFLNKEHNWLIFREFGLFSFFLFLGSAFWQLFPAVVMVTVHLTKTLQSSGLITINLASFHKGLQKFC